jgi:acetyl esterase/lipase
VDAAGERTGVRAPAWRVAALALTGWTLFASVWIVLPQPNLVVWILSVFAAEFSLLLALLALAGVVAALRARRLGARVTGRLAPVLGMLAIALAILPAVEARQDARRVDVTLDPTAYLAGLTLVSDAEPSTERYASTVDGDLLLDVYLPTVDRRGAAVPAVVVVHGGAWRRGWRSMTPRWNAWLTRQGYAVFDIDYRLEPPPTWQKAPGDVRCAIGWVRANADRFGVDPDRIALMGGSAGGHLSLLAGYTADDDVFPPTCAPAPSQVAAVVALYPPADLFAAHELAASRVSPLDGGEVLERFIGASPGTAPEAYRVASPLTHVAAGVPPTLLIQGGRDRVVPPGGTAALAARLEEVGVDHTLLRLDYAGHAFDVSWGGWGSQITRPVLAEFLARHL